MASKYDVYKCAKCNNVVMFLDAGSCTPTCCAESMVKLDEQTADATKEKHVPIIKKVDGGYTVTVGSTHHPMLDNHWIQWVELVVDATRMFVELSPGDTPEAFFSCAHGTAVSAREYCNLHGLWKGNF